LRNAIKNLPDRLDPPRDLWPGINLRLDPAARSVQGAAKVRWRIPAMAAAVVVALVTGILIGRDTAWRPAPAAQYDAPVLEVALRGSLQSTEREYQAALQELLTLHYSGARLPGNDTESMRASWEILQNTENQLQLALAEYPANEFLNKKLLELKSRQLRFVKSVVMLEQNDWRNT